MDTVISKLQGTGQHVAGSGLELVKRTQEAGKAFVVETREAGVDFFGSVAAEAKQWRRYLQLRGSLFSTEVRDALSLPRLERSVLERIDGTLRTLDAGVRDRLLALGKGRAARGASKRKRAIRARRPKASPQALAA